MKLPKKEIIPFSKLDIDEIICDYLSDKYGYCINGFDFTAENNTIVCNNIEWDTTD